MNPLNGVASVLVIADDREIRQRYHDALASGGYAVTQAHSFVEALGTTMLDPDVIVLCDLAVFSYPAQTAQVLRVPAEMTPAALVAEVHRRVALRATLRATISLAA
jgi:DNA-binding response OmpR family regulator